MPILFTDIDKKLWFRQPNLVRWRHMFRSPRQSLKINQELGQTHYDLSRINVRAEDNEEELESIKDYFFDGWDLDGLVDFDWYDDATPGEEPAYIIGLDEMSARIERLRDRIRSLEN